MPGKRQNKKRADGDDEAASTNPAAAEAPETAPQAAADSVLSPVADTPTRSALDTPSRGPDVGAFAPPPTPISSFNTAPAAPTSLETQPAQPQRAAGGVTSYGSLDPVAKPAEPAQQTVRARSNSGDNNKGDAVVTMRHSTGATTVVPIEQDRPTLTKSGSAAPPHDEVDLAITAQLRRAFTSNWQMKVLLVTVPFAILGEGVLSPSVLFLCSFLGLIPLAGMLGDFTEDLALHSNDVIGALLNVTFGNATELIISITALRAGMFDVIKLSLIGSVMGNMLLVLGTAFLVGGTRVKTMVFNTDAVNTYGPLLLLSVLGFVIPSAYWSVSLLREDKLQRSSTILRVSRMEALVMCAVYAAYLYFQLVTHKSVFDGEEEDTPKEATSLTIPTHEDAESDDDDEETPQFTLAFGVAGLAIASVLISLLSDVLVATLSEAAVEWAVPKQFIGIILVPIVGNAAEHATAIVMAAKNKLDIAVGVALGSSIQIALFVMPVLVLIGWVIDAPLTLNFHPFLTIITAACVLVVNQIVADGKTNWLEGLMLVSAYLLLALVFWNGTVDMS